MKITFLGAAEQVTGSKYLIENDDTRILVECGLLQGVEQLTKHNWDEFPVEPQSIDAIVLTHAHLDHIGYVPKLMKDGFAGKVYCSKGTYQLAEIVLKDSGSIQELDAKHAQEKQSEFETPIEPLYTQKEAEQSLKFFEIVDYDIPFTVDTLDITLIQSGHILGGSFVVVSNGKKMLTFSGDLGRQDQLIMKAPPYLKQTDYLVLESTYGDRVHEKNDPLTELAAIINETIAQRGVLLIPAFAIGRTQMILYCLYQLLQKNMIPHVPIFVDSPMATAVTELYCLYKEEHKLSPAECKQVFSIATYVRTVQESKKMNTLKEPAIVIAGSGMAAGGRIIHHLMHRVFDKENTVLFVGYQAEGTLGRQMINGADKIEIYDRLYDVRASIKMLDLFSAHADSNEILDWLDHFEKKPKQIFLTHGQLESAQALKKKIQAHGDWSVVIPKYGETFELL